MRPTIPKPIHTKPPAKSVRAIALCIFLQSTGPPVQTEQDHPTPGTELTRWYPARSQGRSAFLNRPFHFVQTDRRLRCWQKSFQQVNWRMFRCHPYFALFAQFEGKFISGREIQRFPECFWQCDLPFAGDGRFHFLTYNSFPYKGVR